MDKDNCPVTLAELKRHLRVTTDDMDSQLQMLLLAGAEYIENFTLIDFLEDYKDVDIPFTLRAAILMTAGRLFENPTDPAFTLPTAAMNLAKPYKRWDRIRKLT